MSEKGKKTSHLWKITKGFAQFSHSSAIELSKERLQLCSGFQEPSVLFGRAKLLCILQGLIDVDAGRLRRAPSTSCNSRSHVAALSEVDCCTSSSERVRQDIQILQAQLFEDDPQPLSQQLDAAAQNTVAWL